MPECPPFAVPADDKAVHDRWHAFMKEQDVWKLYDKANAAGRALGKAAKRVFAIPARTYRGAVEKVKIAYLATGDGEGTGTGDADLEAYQDIETPWMANAITDLERLAGASVAALTEPDPAVVAFAELVAAWTAFKALPDGVEDQIDEAAYRRVAVARDAVRDAVPISQEGVAAKVRAMLEPYRADVDAVGLDRAYDRSAKSMLPFLEGAPPPAPKPDPVVTLFAEWGSIQDEANALSAANPEATSGELNDRYEAALDRRDVVEDKIMGTPATSIKGVAVKVRLASHHTFDVADLAPLHKTPSRDIDYFELEGGRIGAMADYLISALRDAERLAGVS